MYERTHFWSRRWTFILVCSPFEHFHVLNVFRPRWAQGELWLNIYSNSQLQSANQYGEKSLLLKIYYFGRRAAVCFHGVKKNKMKKKKQTQLLRRGGSFYSGTWLEFGRPTAVCLPFCSQQNANLSSGSSKFITFGHRRTAKQHSQKKNSAKRSMKTADT